MAAVGQETVADEFGLLLEPVAVEAPALRHGVGIAAERVAHQRQIEAPVALRLPDVGHFVDEQPLQRQAARWRNRRDNWSLSGWKWMLPVGAMTMPLGWNGHHLRRTIRHAVIIDRVAEHRSRQRDFAGGEGTGTFHRRAELGLHDTLAQWSARTLGHAQIQREGIPHERDR